MDLPTKSSYGSSALATILGAWSLSQWAAFIGIILAVATFAVNWYFKKKMRDDTNDHYRKTRQIQEDHYESEERQHNQD